jgi:hypothetical protein
MRARVVVLAAVACLLGGIGGCGEEEGVAEGATVTVYVDASLCGAAERELEAENARAGTLRVRLFCLARAEHGKRLSLATVGANARRASEDATTIGYLEPPGPATRFSAPILEAAGIAEIQTSSGKTGMARLLDAIGEADRSSLRESVREAME